MKEWILTLCAAGLVWAASPLPEGAERDRLLAKQAALAAAVRNTPSDVESWRSLGFVHQALGEPEKAADSFKKVVEFASSDAAGWYMLALTYEKLGRKSDAGAAWRACLKHAVKPDMAATARKHLAFLGAL